MSNLLSDAQAADGGAKIRKQTLWLLESGSVPVTRAAFPEKQYYKQRVTEGFQAWKWERAAVARFSLWKDCARSNMEETWRRRGERGWGKVGNRGAPQPLQHPGDGTSNQQWLWGWRQGNRQKPQLRDRSLPPSRG